MIWGVILEFILYIFVDVIFAIIWDIIKKIYNVFIWMINLFKTVIFSIFSEVAEKTQEKKTHY